MKRQRELARAEKRRDKAARRAIASRDKTDSDRLDSESEDIDPDIAHIVAGPQPIPWADEFPDDEDEEEGQSYP